MKPVNGCALIGAARALSGIRDAVVLQHSVVGCHWGSLSIGMLQRSHDFRQASTVVYEENVIRGGTELIPKGLTNIKQLYPDVKVIFVISGCIPNMIGDDTQNAIDLWQKENPGYTVLHVPAPGYAGSEGDGMERAWMMLLKLMGNKKNSLKLPEINILGITASDPYGINDLKYLRKIFYGKINIGCALQQCSSKEISRMGEADLNIVFGRGVKLAQAMEETFGVPYVCCDYPYGIQSMKDFLEILEEKLSVDLSDTIRQIETKADHIVKNSAMYLTTLYQLPAALMGDKAHRSGMKRFLQDELGMEIAVEADADTTDQNLLEQKVKDSNAVLLLASSFQAELARRFSLPLVRYVYPVVDEVCLTQQPMIGSEGTAWLIQQIVNASLQMPYKTDGAYGGLRKTGYES